MMNLCKIYFDILINACSHVLLQAQMRYLTGFVETRQQLLTLKPNHRTNWIGFAVAHHLNSKYDFFYKCFL